VLLAIALVRLVASHALGWAWLSFFPAIGVVAALAGSAVLASLRRREAIDVIGLRLRRLLPPFWLFGLVVVPVMLWHGFGEDPRPEVAQWLFWVLPVLDPPGSAWTADAIGVLGSVRTYLWLVLLAPLLLAAWRRRPVVALVVPLGIVAGDALLGGVISSFGGMGSAVVDASVFAGAWMVGYAHRDGSLRRLAAGWTVLLAAAAIAAGIAWALTHPVGGEGPDLDDIPLGQALVSLGAVLLLLRRPPQLAWVERVPGLGRLLTVVRARAVTIFLWSGVAVVLAPLVDQRLGWPSTGALIGVSAVLTTALALGLGWVEDLAAGRRAALIPGPDQRALRRRAPRRPAPTPPVIGDGGLALPTETRESPLAALNALRPASDFRRDPRFATAAPVTTRALPPGRAPSPVPPPGRPSGPVPSVPFRAAPSGPLPRVSDPRRSGPPSRPGPAVRPGPDHEEEAVTGVVGRAPTGRGRLLSFGGDEPATETVDPTQARPGSGRHSSRPDATPASGRGSHRADDDAPPVHDPGAPSRHRR
jgi:hypothetical protein